MKLLRRIGKGALAFLLTGAVAGSMLAGVAAIAPAPNASYYLPNTYGYGYYGGPYDRDRVPYYYGGVRDVRDSRYIPPYTVNWPNYFAMQPSSVSYLGGVKAPRYLVRDVAVNNMASGVKVIGRSERRGSDKSLLIYSSTAHVLDFAEVLGRAEDKSLCLTLYTVGTGVADSDQVYVGLYGKLSQFEALKDEGLESLALMDKNQYVRVTVELSSLLRHARAAFKEKDASVGESYLYLGLQPGKEEFEGTYTSNIHTIKAYVITEGKNVEISSLLGDAHIMLRTNSSRLSVLTAKKLGEDIKATSRTFTTQASGPYATGYLPWGSVFAAMQ